MDLDDLREDLREISRRINVIETNQMQAAIHRTEILGRIISLEQWRMDEKNRRIHITGWTIAIVFGLPALISFLISAYVGGLVP